MSIILVAKNVPLDKLVVLFPPSASGNVGEGPGAQKVQLSALTFHVPTDDYRHGEYGHATALVEPLHSYGSELSREVAEVDHLFSFVWDSRKTYVKVKLRATWDHENGSVLVKLLQMHVDQIDVAPSQGQGRLSLGYGTGAALKEYLERHMTLASVDVQLTAKEIRVDLAAA